MEKKYKLTNESIEFYGAILYRIEALKDFSDVKKGDKGGFIESEDNLSHSGNCWVYDDARVCDYAKIYNNAKIRDKAQVFGRALVYDDAEVSGYAQVYGNSQVNGKAMVYGKAKVYGYAQINYTMQIQECGCGVIDNIHTAQ